MSKKINYAPIVGDSIEGFIPQLVQLARELAKDEVQFYSEDYPLSNFCYALDYDTRKQLEKDCGTSDFNLLGFYIYINFKKSLYVGESFEVHAKFNNWNLVVSGIYGDVDSVISVHEVKN